MSFCESPALMSEANKKCPTPGRPFGRPGKGGSVGVWDL